MRRGRCAWILLVRRAPGRASPPRRPHAITASTPCRQNARGARRHARAVRGRPRRGALAARPPDPPLAGSPQDIAVTPDGRFAYVMTATADGRRSIDRPFARVAADGRLSPTAPAAADAAASRGSSSTRRARGSTTGSRATSIFLRDDQRRRHARAPSTPSRSPTPAPRRALRAVPRDDARRPQPLRGAVRRRRHRARLAVRRSTLRPGVGAPKNPTFVAFPARPAARTDDAGAWRSRPSAGHLYLATDTPGSGSGAGRSIPPPAPSRRHRRGAAGRRLRRGRGRPVAGRWRAVGPERRRRAGRPERIRQFAVGADGALAPLAPPAVNYVVASAGARPDRQPRTARPCTYRAVARDDRRRAQPLRERHRARGSVRIWQFDVDPASGRGRVEEHARRSAGPAPPAGRPPAPVAWRSPRRAATSTSPPTRRALGIGRWAIDPATGALTGGTVRGAAVRRLRRGRRRDVRRPATRCGRRARAARRRRPSASASSRSAPPAR